MFRTKFFIYLFLACLLAGCTTARPSRPPAGREDMVGLSGKLNPEAETAYAEARVLWKRTLSSVSAVEPCSDPEKAVVLLDKAIALEPGYAEALVRRGLATSELGEREGAFDDLPAAIRLNPSAESYAYRAFVSIRANQIRAAQKDLEYSLKKDSKQHLAKNITGVLALTLDDKAQACSQFQQGCSSGGCSYLDAAKADKICL